MEPEFSSGETLHEAGAAKCADGDVTAGASKATPGEALQVLSTPLPLSVLLSLVTGPPSPTPTLKLFPIPMGP